MLVDHFGRDHVSGAGLMQGQSGGDGNQIAAFDNPGFERFALQQLDHFVGAFKAARLVTE